MDKINNSFEANIVRPYCLSLGISVTLSRTQKLVTTVFNTRNKTKGKHRGIYDAIKILLRSFTR